MKVKEVLKILEDDGWYIDRIRGSHRILKLEVLKEDGKPIPEPSTKVGQVAVNI